MEAMLDLATGKPSRALLKLKVSIVQAEESLFFSEVGLACELAASVHRRQGDKDSLEHARNCVGKAIAAYQQWGATAKVEQLRKS